MSPSRSKLKFTLDVIAPLISAKYNFRCNLTLGSIRKLCRENRGRPTNLSRNLKCSQFRVHFDPVIDKCRSFDRGKCGLSIISRLVSFHGVLTMYFSLFDIPYSWACGKRRFSKIVLTPFP